MGTFNDDTVGNDVTASGNGALAFSLFLYCGIRGETKRCEFVAPGAQHQFAQVLQASRWPSLARKMAEFDSRPE